MNPGLQGPTHDDEDVVVVVVVVVVVCVGLRVMIMRGPQCPPAVEQQQIEVKVDAVL